MPIRQMKLVKDAVTAAQIDEVERQIGIPIPVPYREFLLENNGGRPEPAAFDYGAGPYQDSVVDGFACIQEGHVFDLRELVDTYRERVPGGTLPIAQDVFGNVVLIGTEGDIEGRIFFWDHEQEVEDGKVPDFSNVSRVADSFEQFVEMLHDEPA